MLRSLTLSLCTAAVLAGCNPATMRFPEKAITHGAAVIATAPGHYLQDPPCSRSTDHAAYCMGDVLISCLDGVRQYTRCSSSCLGAENYSLSASCRSSGDTLAMGRQAQEH